MKDSTNAAGIKKESVVRLAALCLLIVNILLQVLYVSYFDSSFWFAVFCWIQDCGMYNFALLYSIVQCVFGEIPLLGLAGFVVIVALYAAGLISLILNKKQLFVIPLFLVLADIVCSLIMGGVKSIGLIYKLFECVLYSVLIITSRKSTIKIENR